MIGEQKQNVILGMLQLAYYNSEIDWKTGEVKMMRCLDEYEKQWRSKQEKLGWQKQKDIKHSLHQRAKVCRVGSDIYSICKTPCWELDDVDLLEKPWLQSIYYTICLSYGHNFRELDEF